MEKIKYTEYVNTILGSQGWEGGYPNRPHWLAGDQVIFGPTVENPNTGRTEYFQLRYEKPCFRKMRVTLTRIIRSNDPALINNPMACECYDIRLTDDEVNGLVDLLPMINQTIGERIVQQNAKSEVERETKNWWP